MKTNMNINNYINLNTKQEITITTTTWYRILLKVTRFLKNIMITPNQITTTIPITTTTPITIIIIIMVELEAINSKVRAKSNSRNSPLTATKYTKSTKTHSVNTRWRNRNKPNPRWWPIYNSSRTYAGPVPNPPKTNGNNRLPSPI